jgi:Carboxypeptidase regulatory-like domain
MIKKCFWGLVIAALVATLSLSAFGQNESAVKGNLAGVVLDSSGAVILGAKVTAVGPTGNRDATTDNDGRFVFPLVTPGTYALKIEKQGFRSAEVKGIEVVISKTSSVSINMQPGGSSETVEVSADAVTVDTTSTGVGANLNDTFYSRVPIARNVTGLFYASAGVTSGGGTGAGNPSISGGSGLENQYVADGVNITDGGFGGIGVYTVNYGSLSTGINLSFVKEVQVKTGGFEPQYGKSTGGVVQIVTKSGSNAFHGGVSGFFGPQQFESERINPDPVRLNQAGLFLHQQGYDVSGELGGYIPGAKNRLFFFGSFNPTWNTQFEQFADLHGTYAFPQIGTPVDFKQTIYNYAAKLTFRLSDSHNLESSVFGDPTRGNMAPNLTTVALNDTVDSKLSSGTRNWVVRYNGTLSPTWLINSSLSWGHNYLNESPKNPDIYGIGDVTGCGFLGNPSSSCRAALQPGTFNGPLGTPLSGQFTRQGLGFYEDTQGDNWAWNIDTQKIFHKLGEHALSIGYRYERLSYSGGRERSGPDFTITPNIASDWALPNAAGLTSNWAGQLRVITSQAACVGTFFPNQAAADPNFDCPMLDIPGYGLKRVYLRQTRGEFGDHSFDTHGRYHAAYFNDAWTINKHVTVNLGYRWEQQMMQGSPYTDFQTGEAVHSHYTFTDNWSPRFGLAIDPVGDKKTKIFGNFARYSYAIPLDMAIRSLSAELDSASSSWLPVADANNMVVVNSNGTLANPIFDDAHFGTSHGLGSVSLSSGEFISSGTKMQYLQEWVAGVEHEFPHGIVFSARWTDRRLKRIVEDMAGISPEAFQCCLAQNYTISNPSPSTDLYVNPIQRDFPVGGLFDQTTGDLINPAGCASGVGGTAADFDGNSVGDFCIDNPDVAGALGSDGKADGFWNPNRKYKSLEFEVNKSFSRGWMMRTNYRWAQLSGNYEGAFRNDNGQSDPSISSLFDFVAGDFGLLGTQAAAGWLNTDVRHIINSFMSYTFSNGKMRGLTLGSGVRVSGGTPVSDFRAHPAYQNAGEIPQGGRGALGRTPFNGQADVHAEYVVKFREKHNLHFGADLFNITNQKTLLRINQNQDLSYLVTNVDFKKPAQGTGLNPNLGYQSPFRARLFVKWDF